LERSLQRAGDDHVELYPQGVQISGDDQTLFLAFLIERTLGINNGVRAAHTGAGVSKYVKVHLVGTYFSLAVVWTLLALRG